MFKLKAQVGAPRQEAVWGPSPVGHMVREYISSPALLGIPTAFLSKAHVGHGVCLTLILYRDISFR